MEEREVNDQDIISAIQAIAALYGRERAMWIERLFREETAHFKSGNFLNTFSPGMEVGRDHNNTPIMILPYGWGRLSPYWTQNPEYAPSGTMNEVENTSAMAKSKGERIFIKFPDIMASMMSVAFLISLRGGNIGAWNTTDPAGQLRYQNLLSQIVPRFTIMNVPA
jgi:hypothetical protein